MRTLLRITHYALRITHYALRITHYALRITHYALRITHYALRITHYALRITHYPSAYLDVEQPRHRAVVGRVQAARPVYQRPVDGAVLQQAHVLSLQRGELPAEQVLR